MPPAGPQPVLPSPTSRGPQLLHFRLRQMFFMVTALSILCALLVKTTGAWPLVIGSFTLLIAAHVFANLIGTRLRDTSHEVKRWQSQQHGPNAEVPIPRTDPAAIPNLPPTTPLASSDPTARWVPWLVVLGLLLGAALGIGILAQRPQITWPGLAIGTISSAVFGAWIAFVANSFSFIAHHAWRHAHENSKEETQRTRKKS